MVFFDDSHAIETALQSSIRAATTVQRMVAPVAILILSLATFSCTSDDGIAPDQGIPPVVTHSSIRILSPQTAEVTGLVKTKDRAAIFLVEYGPTNSYGMRTKNIALPPDTAAREVRDTVSGLTPGSLVHFRVLASSPAGSATGPDKAVTMPDYPVEFNIPLAVGTEWTYGYTYRWNAQDHEYKNITGIHTWRLLSDDTTSMPRTYGFVAHKVDSVWQRTRDGRTGGYIDTSYHVVQDIPFTARVSVDSITIQWPATIAQGSIPVDRILRFVDKGTTTLRLKGIFSGAINYDALYEQGKGLVSYASSISVMSGAYTLTFTLTSLVKP